VTTLGNLDNRRHRHEMPSVGGSVDDPSHSGRSGVDAAVGTVTAARFAVQFVGAGPGAADLLTVPRDADARRGRRRPLPRKLSGSHNAGKVLSDS